MSDDKPTGLDRPVIIPNQEAAAEMMLKLAVAQTQLAVAMGQLRIAIFDPKMLGWDPAPDIQAAFENATSVAKELLGDE